MWCWVHVGFEQPLWNGEGFKDIWKVICFDQDQVKASALDITQQPEGCFRLALHLVKWLLGVDGVR